VTSTLPVKLPQGSPVHWVLRALGVAAVAYLLVGPLLRDLSPSDYGQLTDIVILALAALSLNLLIGFTGQISIGHSAFFGLGAYTTAILMDTHGWTPGSTFPVAVLLCFAVGVFVGVPALRLAGVYLSLVTLALAQLFPALIRKFDSITEGSAGVDGLSYEPPSWTGLETTRLDEAKWLYIVALFFLAIGYVVMRNLVKSRVGRAMVAVRDNTTAAAVMGVNVSFVKIITFGVSAALCGLAGCAFVLRQTQATPENVNYTILGAILFLVIMVIGGTASLLGPIVGAFVYYRVDEFTRELPDKGYLPSWFQDFLEGRPNLATVVFATLLIVLMFVAPFGIVGFAKRLARHVLVVVPRPPIARDSASPPPAEPEVGSEGPSTPFEVQAPLEQTQLFTNPKGDQ
jgi:branched-chain amino acid transport system permease protein